MLKKRLVFTLLFSDGYFMLSRNFRLQQIGNLEWLERNYVFSNISEAIDELVVLNVSRDEPQIDQFSHMLKCLTRECFIPIAAGGWVRNVQQARQLLQSGADKVVVNTPVFGESRLVEHLAEEFGRQCIVAAVDLSRSQTGIFEVRVEGGRRALPGTASEWLTMIHGKPIGDVYLNSIDRDGTGQGFDIGLLDQLPHDFQIPVILAGGAGNVTHLGMGLEDERVDAVATAHLLNFVGDGLHKSRQRLLSAGIYLPARDIDIQDLRATLDFSEGPS